MAGIFADVGIRVIQITYNIANHLGSSCWEPSDGGLTRAGHRMVPALNEAGVLVDISHVGNVTGRETVDASSGKSAFDHAASCDLGGTSMPKVGEFFGRDSSDAGPRSGTAAKVSRP